MLDLGRQFRQRQRAWMEELRRQLYTPVQAIPMEGFTTLERLTPEAAEAHAFRAYTEGEAWGACWEYGWFRGDITLPESCEGRRVVLLGQVGGEQLYYINGCAAGAVDKEHTYITLSRRARAGENYHVLVESYAGHGARLENIGPCPPERPAIPPTPPKQCVVGKSIVAVWNEEAYQLLLDVYTLDKLLQVLPDKSLRAQRVAAALQAYTDIADFELPPEARQESFRRAREALREVMACHNGSTAPLMWLIGQSHIDLAWLWPMEETYHKMVRTYSNQMALLDEYPAYRFLLCEPVLLDMLREMDGALWQRVKDAYARGQILPEGAFYVECDTNLPSGESLIRQLQWGKAWFREQFGVDSQVGWLPDCFGFSAALPQILRGFGVKYFGTQKLQRADPECERFPYHHFIWEGMDGSEVLGLSFMKDNGPVDPVSFKERWEDNRVQATHIDTLLHPFGYGDGGGGPTRDMVELSLRLGDLEGVGRSRYGGLREYFEHIAAQGVKNRWVGEMYLPWHRGVYTAQRRAKALMRRAEFALHDAEALAARQREGREALRLRELWRKLLICQFHDVAGGVGIRRTHEEAEQALNEVIAQAQAMTRELRRSYFCIRDAEDAYVAYNPLPWERREWVLDSQGQPRYVSVPADGAAPVTADCACPQDAHLTESAEGYVLENRYLTVAVDASGAIVRLTDRESGQELLHPGQKMNDWRLYQNVQPVYDAWELDRGWETRKLERCFDTKVTVEASGPSYAAVQIVRRFGDSVSVQKMRLFAGSRRIDFVTEVDWQERHRMLKAHFESNILTEDAVHEIQFGYVRRPAHRSTPYASDRYEVCNHRYSALCEDERGFAVLNDGCYGISANRGELALTLLRAPLVPDDTNNRGQHTFTYALYVFNTSLARSDTVRQGYALNAPLVLERGQCPEAVAGFRTEGSGVLLESVKIPEDGRGIILRLYESQHVQEHASLELPFPAALEECGMDESQAFALGHGQRFTLSFTPFQVRTFRVLPDEQRKEKNMKKLILCFDCGDTLVDEGTQVFAENEDVLSAEPIPGALEALRYFREQGYRLALVADGRVASFQNILGKLGIWDWFEAHIISEAVGELKPSPKMFQGARQALGLTEADFSRMVMFGNNRLRDIKGANGVGMISVLLDYSPRYVKTASMPDEEPTYLTRLPAEWPTLIDRLEAETEKNEE